MDGPLSSFPPSLALSYSALRAPGGRIARIQGVCISELLIENSSKSLKNMQLLILKSFDTLALGYFSVYTDRRIASDEKSGRGRNDGNIAIAPAASVQFKTLPRTEPKCL